MAEEKRVSKRELSILIELVGTELKRMEAYKEELKALLNNLYDQRDPDA